MLVAGGSDFPRIWMGWDCFWDSEDLHGGYTAQLICSLLLYWTRLPLGQAGATKSLNIQGFYFTDTWTCVRTKSCCLCAKCSYFQVQIRQYIFFFTKFYIFCHVFNFLRCTCSAFSPISCTKLSELKLWPHKKIYIYNICLIAQLICSLGFNMWKYCLLDREKRSNTSDILHS